MKRDATGKFTSNGELEAKRRVGVTLTDTAWRLLKEDAQKVGISRSEVIEGIARGFARTRNQSPEAKGYEPDQECVDRCNLSYPRR